MIPDLAQRAREAAFAVGSENRQRLEAMLRGAESEPPLADPGDAWDAHPWLLALPTASSTCAPASCATGDPPTGSPRTPRSSSTRPRSCPRWERFLGEIFCDDAELIDYIWRSVGYSLTGAVAEQCVFMGHGAGANGKTVFLAILRDLAGEYAFNAPFATFEAKGARFNPERPGGARGRSPGHRVGDE